MYLHMLYTQTRAGLEILLILQADIREPPSAAAYLDSIACTAGHEEILIAQTRLSGQDGLRLIGWVKCCCSLPDRRDLAICAINISQLVWWKLLPAHEWDALRLCTASASSHVPPLLGHDTAWLHRI